MIAVPWTIYTGSVRPSDSQAGISFNLAYVIIAVYITLAAAAILLLGRPLARTSDSLIILGARYSSLLLSVAPFVVAASLWTAVLSAIGKLGFAAIGRPGFVRRSVVDALAIDASSAGAAPLAIAISGALSPVTVAAVAGVFGLNSGMLLFYAVFALGLPAAAATVARRATVAQPAPATVQMPHPAERIFSELYHRLRYTILGLLVVTAIHVLLPDQAVGFLHDAPILAVVAAALLAFVLPLSAEAAPFAAALFLSTAGHGAAFAFLLVAAFGGLRLTRAAFR